MASTETTHDDLAKRLEELQETDHFDPPEAFVAEAMDTDDSLWKEAEKDPVAWWGGAGEGPPLVLRVGHGARRLRPARTTRGSSAGKINASVNCVDWHVAAGGRPDRLLLRGRAGRPPPDDDLRGTAGRGLPRCANALKELGVKRGDRCRD